MKNWLILAGTAIAASALATDFLEVEDNNTKAAANAFTMTPLDALVGNSTGASTTVAGTTSADYFRVKTTPDVLGIYQYRLVITTAGAVGHTGTLRGLSQSVGVIGTVDSTVQTSSTTTTPPRFIQWYGFGKEEEVYYRVAGTATTTSDYRAELQKASVTVTDIGSFLTGSIRFTAILQGHTTDTDLWLYDNNLNAIADAGNDDTIAANNGGTSSLQSTLIRTLTPGTYYMAISSFNLANNLPSPADDNFRTGIVLDFPNAIADSSTTSAVNTAFAVIDSAGTHPFAATRTGPFDILWFKFTVAAPGPTIVAHDNTGVLPAPGSVLGGTDANVDVSDDGYWELRPGITFSTAQDPCRVELIGHAPGAAPSLLELAIESRGSVGNMQQTVQAFDYTANGGAGAYVIVAGSPTTLPFGGSADAVFVAALAPSANYINAASTPANEMKMRVSWRAMAIVFSYPWKARIDQAVWRYTP